MKTLNTINFFVHFRIHFLINKFFVEIDVIIIAVWPIKHCRHKNDVTQTD